MLFTYPGTGVDWNEEIPGVHGCTLENRLFRDAWPAFRRAGVDIRGISTQLPREQAEFARAEDIRTPSSPTPATNSTPPYGYRPSAAQAASATNA